MARTYLVVIDDSPEARVALRFAARRASKTDGEVDVLAVVVRGEHDDGGIHQRRVVGLQPVQHFPAADVGQGHVQDQQLGLEVGQHAHGVGPAAGPAQLERHVLERDLEQGELVVVVFNTQGAINLGHNASQELMREMVGLYMKMGREPPSPICGTS